MTASTSLKDSMFRIIRFLVTGVINTAAGFLTIFVLIHAAGFSDVVANLTGYAVGLCISFVLNKNWTFASKRSFRTAAPRFAAVVVLAYAANLVTMLVLNRHYNWPIDWANLLAVAPYTVILYIGSRWFVFPVDASPDRDGRFSRIVGNVR